MAALSYQVLRPAKALTSKKLSSLLFSIRWFTSSIDSGVDHQTASSSFRGPNQSGVPLRREPNQRNVQWVFLGCPGVGKGTYASRLSNLLGVPHIATGDLVREELSSSGPLAPQVNF